MALNSLRLPPVSEEFYHTLIKTFPPLLMHDIREDTSMLSIQRRAGQQEVIDFIKRAVRKEPIQQDKKPLLTRIKEVFLYR